MALNKAKKAAEDLGKGVPRPSVATDVGEFALGIFAKRDKSKSSYVKRMNQANKDDDQSLSLMEQQSSPEMPVVYGENTTHSE